MDAASRFCLCLWLCLPSPRRGGAGGEGVWSRLDQQRPSISRACRRRSGSSTSAAIRSAKSGSKDRKGRALAYEDLNHYQQIVAALAETIHLMAAVDETIEEHGGWPMG